MHFYQEDQHKYFKNMDIKDLNEIVAKLGVRIKDLDLVISELHFITKDSLGQNAEIDH